MVSNYATQRARLATTFLALVGVLAAGFLVTDWLRSLPLLVFYVVLLVNTYASVRTFTTITPRGARFQELVDWLLLAFYCLLALALGDPLNFTLAALFLFTTATAKYVFLGKLIGPSTLLARKVRVDALGVLMCALAMLGVLAGYPDVATVALAAVFTGANVYLLAVNPLYRFPENGDRQNR